MTGLQRVEYVNRKGRWYQIPADAWGRSLSSAQSWAPQFCDPTAIGDRAVFV